MQQKLPFINSLLNMEKDNNSPYTYKKWFNEALLEVGKKILKTIETKGLYGNIHFFITFHTTCPLVKIPVFLKEKYPNLMTIVLQNQFKNLKCEKNGFEVTLYFLSKPTPLFISWESLVQIIDPVSSISLPFSQDKEVSKKPTPLNKTKIIKFPKT